MNFGILVLCSILGAIGTDAFLWDRLALSSKAMWKIVAQETLSKRLYLQRNLLRFVPLIAFCVLASLYSTNEKSTLLLASLASLFIYLAAFVFLFYREARSLKGNGS
ncbi:MAG TPA: hypothetical protein VD768_01140 [Sphingomicrobium sp.]|nr:hypothetical protein [Sphingomicrobium sp.]